MTYDHVLLIGFGGPEKREDVMPFVQRVAEGRAIPEARLQIVEHHYDLIGGFSPYNQNAFQLKDLLEKGLREQGLELPVFLGMRNWNPFLKDTVQEIHKQGFKKGLGIILAVQRSLESCARYKDNVTEALKTCGAEDLGYDYLPAWYAHPYFIEAQAAQVRKTVEAAGLTRADVHYIFTVHSIPVETAQGCALCDYREDFKETSRLVADSLGAAKWSTAYQSRSGNPRQAWLEPDILDEIRRLSSAGERSVVVVPVGFLFENAEILYDLDIEARALAAAEGLGFYRAPTVMGHSLFLKMLTDLTVRKANVR